MDVKVGHKEGWVPKNWWFRTVVLGKTLESPLDCKEIKQVNPKGNQPWIFTERTDAEAPILPPSDAKSWLTGKDPDDGKDWRHEEKGMTEDEMIGWHHQVNGHEFEQAPGDDEGQGSLVCCSPWGHKELDMTEWLNNNKLPQGHPWCPGACQIIQISHLTGSPGNLTKPALTIRKLISLSPAYYHSCPWIYLLYVALPGSFLWFGAATIVLPFICMSVSMFYWYCQPKKKNPKSYKIGKSHFSHLIILVL